MQVFDNQSLGSMPETLRHCELRQIDVCLELELLGSSSLRTSHVEALHRAVMTNAQRITTVKFHLHGDDWLRMSSVNRTVVSQLAANVSRLPCLKELIIIGGFVPLPAVTNLLLLKNSQSSENNAKNNNLQALKLEKFRNMRTYDTNVLLAFSRALRQSRDLKSFSFAPHVAAGLEVREDPFLGSLFEALASLPILKEVKVVSNANTMAGPSLKALCNLTTLTRLELDPQKGIGVDVVNTLVKSTTIQEVLLSCAYNDPSSKALARLIESNSTVTKLTLLFHESWRDDNTNEPYILPLARALSTNSSLSHVKIYFGRRYPTNTILQAMLSIFRTNFTLLNLELSEHASRAQNMSYEDIERLPEGNEKTALLLCKRIQYYTMMNCSGRGALLEQTACAAGRQQWIRKLLEFSYSLDHVYYFLRLNPTLCSTRVLDNGNGNGNSACDVAQRTSKKRGRQVVSD